MKKLRHCHPMYTSEGIFTDRRVSGPGVAVGRLSVCICLFERNDL